MNKLLLLSITGAACLCASSIGIADSDTLNSMDDVMSHPAGPYVGLALGVGGLDTPKLSNNNSFIHEDIRKGLTGRIFGGYLVGSEEFKYGAELGGLMYPQNHYDTPIAIPYVSTTYANYSYHGYTIDLLGVLKYDFNHLSLTGKAGLGYVSQKFDLHFARLTAHEDISNTQHKILPELSVSIGYSFGPCQWDITYAHLFGKKPIDGWNKNTEQDLYKNVASVDAVMLGMTYYFSS